MNEQRVQRPGGLPDDEIKQILTAFAIIMYNDCGDALERPSEADVARSRELAMKVVDAAPLPPLRRRTSALPRRNGTPGATPRQADSQTHFVIYTPTLDADAGRFSSKCIIL